MQDRQTDLCACAHPHSHPHKCHYVVCCVLKPSALYSLSGWSPHRRPRMGICPIPKVSLSSDMAGSTLDAALTSATLAFTFGHWCSSGGKSESADICDRSQADSFSDSHFAYPNVFLYQPLFDTPHSFFSLFLFSHKLSALLIVKQHVYSCVLLCSPNAIFVGFLVFNSASKVTLARQSDGHWWNNRDEFPVEVQEPAGDCPCKSLVFS